MQIICFDNNMLAKQKKMFLQKRATDRVNYITLNWRSDYNFQYQIIWFTSFLFSNFGFWRKKWYDYFVMMVLSSFLPNNFEARTKKKYFKLNDMIDSNTTKVFHSNRYFWKRYSFLREQKDIFFCEREKTDKSLIPEILIYLNVNCLSTKFPFFSTIRTI